MTRATRLLNRYLQASSFTRITLSEENFIDKLKMISNSYSFDKSMLAIEITEDAIEKDREIATQNVVRCKELGFRVYIKVICEGVETEEQNALVSSSACDFVQGSYYSKALPLEECESFIELYAKSEIRYASKYLLKSSFFSSMCCSKILEMYYNGVR